MKKPLPAVTPRPPAPPTNGSIHSPDKLAGSRIIKPAAELPRVSIDEIPMGEIAPGGYVTRQHRIDVTCSSREQHRNLRSLLRGLQDDGQQLRNGKEIRHERDAVRWLLEQLTVTE